MVMPSSDNSLFFTNKGDQVLSEFIRHSFSNTTINISLHFKFFNDDNNDSELSYKVKTFTLDNPNNDDLYFFLGRDLYIIRTAFIFAKNYWNEVEKPENIKYNSFEEAIDSFGEKYDLSILE